MNPIAYRMKPEEPLRFLLIGEMVSYRDGKEPERVWNLNIYSSAKSRKTAEKKMKRHSSDSIFIEWDMQMCQPKLGFGFRYNRVFESKIGAIPARPSRAP
ncbi:hypothetical protein LCGC14_2549980 [marine sediment metagenome]|uniref:Uncharacterized protein n=1 Tax=marine sediment metagenome TaxID=412755 RepID=A0A0F9AN11_9ZZZZ